MHSNKDKEQILMLPVFVSVVTAAWMNQQVNV